MENEYSELWNNLFLKEYEKSQTQREVDFITDHLPQPRYTSIIDLCCGNGRHARLLTERGYELLGIDQNAGVVEDARNATGNAISYIIADMRDLTIIPERYDAVINMWQSFGYFDENTNLMILGQIFNKLTQGDRLILDIYNRNFFMNHQGSRKYRKGNIQVTERKYLKDNRLKVQLSYSGFDHLDNFDWQIFTPTELIDAVNSVGFNTLISCTDFNQCQPPNSKNPRMQFVLEK
jgi:SAM-dependent methyltransferase